MIRILQVVNDMHRAGLETMLMNYYRNIDRTRIQFDFLTHRPYKSDYDDEILELGGNVYYAPRLYPQNYPSYFKFMKQFYAEHPEYKIVHSHIDAMSYLPLLAAKKAEIPVRIAHSHSTAIDRDVKYLLKQYYRSQITSVANYYCACGKEAGEYLFKDKEFTIIPNAIQVDKFLYQEQIRCQIRKKLNLSDKTVIGHVGRFSYPKNHRFLISVFNEIYKNNSNSVLLLIGVGEKETEIRNQVESMGLCDSVLFLGNRADVNELYQAMDVFVMPSFFEGVPLTGIEAQFSGLNCIFSDKVPTEVDFSGNCSFISLNEKTEKWVTQILHNCDQTGRSLRSQALKGSQYNIKNACKYLENFYLQLNEKVNN